MSTPELIAPDRLEELLAGALPDTEREADLQGLALTLRTNAPPASQALRERVRAVGPSPARRGLPIPRRRLALVLMPAVLIAAAGSVVAGDRWLGSSTDQTATAEQSSLRRTERSIPPPIQRTLDGQTLSEQGAEPLYGQADTRAKAAPVPVAGTGRAQEVDMWIALTVPDADRLSEAAAEAMAVTRELGGHVASSTVGTQGERGRAEMALRIPVRRVEDALVRLSQLGRIANQRVATVDLQGALDRTARRIEALRSQIRVAQLRLDSGTLSAEERLALEIRVERLRSQLDSAREQSTRISRRAATADLRLVLQTQAAAAPTKESGVGRIVGDALGVLGRIGEVALFAAIVLSPLAVLAVVLFLLRRKRLRAHEAALLEQARPGAPSAQPPRP
jgi:Domain of unknown function (DUF4349)